MEPPLYRPRKPELPLASSIVAPHREEQIKLACKLIAREYEGTKGMFAYQAFEHINQTLYNGELPWPMIRWVLSPYGKCMAAFRGRWAVRKLPIIHLHPAILGEAGEQEPWGIPSEYLGFCLAYDVLIHESIHLYIHYLLGIKGEYGNAMHTSHNNPHWIAEVNRLASLLGFQGVKAGMTVSRRKPLEDVPLTQRDKMPTQVVRHTQGNLPAKVIAGFPMMLRLHRNDLVFYEQEQLPFPFTPLDGEPACVQT